MKNRKFKLLASLFSAAIAALLFTSCMNTMDDMVNDYNEQLMSGNAESDTSGAPLDQTEMLHDRYLVAENETLTLAAPLATFYEWSFYKIEEEVLDPDYGIKQIVYTPVNVKGVIPLYNRVLKLYLPDLAFALKPGETYKLRLVVETESGARYSDEALFAIYRVYEF